MRKITVFLPAVCLTGLLLAAGWTHSLDAQADASLALNTIRKIILTSGGLQVLKIRTWQANYGILLSQDLGESWNVTGSVAGVNAFITNAGRIYPVPEQSVFSGSVSYSPCDMFLFSLDYGVTASVYIERFVFAETLIESEPSFCFTFTAPFGSDWFSLSAYLGAGYYFSPFTRNFGFSAGAVSDFTVPAWDLSLGVSLTAGYYLAGYRGVAAAGLDGVTPAASIQWSPGEVFTVSFTAGYYFSLSGGEIERALNSAPYFQLSAACFVSGDKGTDNSGDAQTNS